MFDVVIRLTTVFAICSTDERFSFCICSEMACNGLLHRANSIAVYSTVCCLGYGGTAGYSMSDDNSFIQPASGGLEGGGILLKISLSSGISPLVFLNLK